MGNAKLSRRQFLALSALALAGCSSQQQDAAPETPAEQPEEPEVQPDAAPDPEIPATAGALVLYFSRADENYNVGVIDEGNTAVMAKMIAQRIGADLFELVPVEPYPESYQECCDVALDEKNAGARPQLEALPDLTPYSTVFLGFPCWWGDIPMPVYTAIEALGWNGKTICPFNTHEGSGDAGMFSTLETVCQGATVADGLTIRGQDAQNDREGTQAEVDTWISGLER